MSPYHKLGSSLLSALCLAGAGQALAFEWKLPWTGAVHTAAPAHGSAVPASSVPALPPGVAPDYRSIVQQTAPAVVGITAQESHEAGDVRPDFNQDPFLQFFRGLPGFGFQSPGAPGQPWEIPFQAQGSGFIISSDGLILTNAHVVRDAKQVTVKVRDRREYKAKVLGSDSVTDVALLRVDAKNLPTVRLGNDRDLQVGDPVLAIGSPFGFEESATQGIVSAKGRSLPGDTAVSFIQTDASVNPGNSGGPLIDGAGKVVGINAQIYSRSGGFQGVAFAVPIDVALKVKDDILSTGHAEHARLGISIQDVDQALAESFKLASPAGALIASVAPGSAAEGAGLKVGDIIMRIDRAAIDRAGDLSSRIGLAAPGDKVQLSVWRDGAEREVTVVLGHRGEHDASQAESSGTGKPELLGLTLRALTDDERRQAHAQHGLEVEAASGPAARAGIEPGDVILAMNGKPVESSAQVRAILEAHPGGVALLVERGGERRFVAVKPG